MKNLRNLFKLEKENEWMKDGIIIWDIRYTFELENEADNY